MWAKRNTFSCVCRFEQKLGKKYLAGIRIYLETNLNNFEKKTLQTPQPLFLGWPLTQVECENNKAVFHLTLIPLIQFKQAAGGTKTVGLDRRVGVV